ncbi:Initiation factor 2B-like protein [Lambiella insularis]|nr:Initiation factor 2B-like protein [Lambiella insularis]
MRFFLPHFRSPRSTTHLLSSPPPRLKHPHLPSSRLTSSTPPPLTPRAIVSSFLCTGPPSHPFFRISLFKRSASVPVYPHLWAACSGSIEPSDASPLAAALREIHEETGLQPPAIELLRAGASYELVDAALATRWTIWPFVWMLRGEGGPEKLQGMVRLGEEHSEVRFVRVEEVEGLETVEGLGRGLRGVLSEVEGEGKEGGGE